MLSRVCSGFSLKLDPDLTGKSLEWIHFDVNFVARAANSSACPNEQDFKAAEQSG